MSAIVQLIQGSINAFTNSQDLVSIATAKIVLRDIALDLMNVHSIGQKCYSTFWRERLEKDTQSMKFHDTLPVNKLKTFSNLCKKKAMKSSGRMIIILKADKFLFGRIIVMAQGRSLKIKGILSHPLGPLAWALSTSDGLLGQSTVFSFG